MIATPRIVIAAPLYNHDRMLPDALDTLLGQSYRDFVLLLLDDCSSDTTPEIGRLYAERDSRVRYERNPQRLGYARNAGRCFERARELYPDATYFAWGSDHDVWHPRWLEVLAGELDEHPEAVMAYAANFIIDEHGVPVGSKEVKQRKKPQADVFARFKATYFNVPVGNAFYGLFRVSALSQVPVMRPHILPDRLLLVELAFIGEIRAVPTFLFYRRYRDLFSTKRQRRASFVDGAPAYAYLPWWLSHSAALYRSYGRAPATDAVIGREQARKIAALYAVYGVAHELGSARVALRKMRRKYLKHMPRKAVAAVAVRLPPGVKSRLRSFRSARD